MIGNIADATLALAAYRDEAHAPILSDDGTSRMVYLINNVVYKVDRYSSWANMAEANAMERITLPEGVFFPEYHLFEIGEEYVMAMEYISGQLMAECWCGDGEEHMPDCMPAHILSIVSEIIGDTGGMNTILKDNGDIYIIDAAN